MELARQAHFHRGGGRILAQALWEIKLDIGLVLMALALALYMEVLFGLLGLQSAARMSAVTRAGTRGVRFAAWERTLRGILLSADDAAQVARVFARRNNGGNNGATDRTIDRAAPEVVFWRGSWSLGDRIALGLMVISLALVLLAPWLTDHTGASALATLAQELQPFPD